MAITRRDWVFCILLVLGATLGVASLPAQAATPPDLKEVEPTCELEPTAEPPGPQIVGLYPNPTTHGNVGEYLVLEIPDDHHVGNLSVTDGHTTATVPDKSVEGRVALTHNATATERLTDREVVELEGTLRLAVDGDDLELHEDGAVIDEVQYERAPLAETWTRANHANTSVTESDGMWQPRDATCKPVTRVTPETATPFVLPDEPDIPEETLRQADERLLLAGYTITDEATADELRAAADRGVDVQVLFESGPVGGTPEGTEQVLEGLTDSEVDVRAIGGEGARYRFHHPKYAIADDQVLVMSENWKPSGTGGASSRGWGVIVEDQALAAALVSVFSADFTGWDTQSAEQFLAETEVVEGDTPTETFPTEHEPEPATVDAVDLLVGPDNAQPALEALLEDADEEILLKQASVSEDADLLETTIDAARRGVEVKLLLDSTWYHEDDHRALQTDLESLAADEDLPLEIRLLEETDRFEKIHAKGVIVDGETAVVGSANWNQNAFENNREVMLALHGEAVAGYYVDVFTADWDGEDDTGWNLPFSLSLTVLAALAIAAFVGHRWLRFGSENEYRS